MTTIRSKSVSQKGLGWRGGKGAGGKDFILLNFLAQCLWKNSSSASGYKGETLHLSAHAPQQHACGSESIGRPRIMPPVAQPLLPPQERCWGPRQWKKWGIPPLTCCCSHCLPAVLLLSHQASAVGSGLWHHCPLRPLGEAGLAWQPPDQEGAFAE